MARLAFDPDRRGARRLARTWLPQLERWRIRLNTDYVQGDHVVEAGDMIEVEAPRGLQLVERGAGELVGIRRASAREYLPHLDSGGPRLATLIAERGNRAVSRRDRPAVADDAQRRLPTPLHFQSIPHTGPS